MKSHCGCRSVVSLIALLAEIIANWDILNIENSNILRRSIEMELILLTFKMVSKRVC